MSKLEQLLEGVEVEWKPLEEVAEIKTGQSVSKNKISSNPGEYPVINSGREPLGFINTWNTENDPIGITSRGAGVGSITWQDGRYFRGNLNYSVTINDYLVLNQRFLYHLLLSFQNEIHQLCTFQGIPALNSGNLKTLQIPIPSLEIQKEIVRILDTFTELTNELTNELNARQKQYDYYNEQLLTFKEGDVDWKKLEEVLDMRAGRHIPRTEIKEEQYNDNIPCFGGNGIRGYVTDYSHNGSHIMIGRQGALCGNVHRYKGKFYATEHAVVGTAKDKLNIDFAYYYLTFMNLNQYKSKSAQPGLAVSKINKLFMAIPPIEEQERIVAILDKFDTLTNSISDGLPKEIALRQKQYEYYREKLLTFPKPAEAS